MTGEDLATNLQMYPHLEGGGEKKQAVNFVSFLKGHMFETVV